MAYRRKDTYISKDPVKRARSLANLHQYRHKTKPIDSKALGGPITESLDIITFAEQHFFIPETRKPIVLLDWEKAIFRDIFFAKIKPTLALLGMPKKRGKSTIAAIVALWTLLFKPMAEVYIMGPDVQQGTLVVFDKIRKAVRMHKWLRAICKVRIDRIEYGDGFIQVLPCNATSAGLNPDLVIFDELWQFTTTEAKRAIDEMTTVPTKEMLTLIVSYAGYEDETDSPLYLLYKAGIDQAEGKEEKDPKFYFIWLTDYEGVPWVTPNYLTLQKKRLRDSSFRRMHRNEWVSSEEQFIDAATIDACINPNHSRGQKYDGPVCIGLDVGPKHDCTAVAVVGKADDETLCIVDHAVFTPPKGGTLDLEKTFENLLVIYQKEYDIRAVYFDPYQAIRSAQTLRKKGLRMVEYPQTVANLVQIADTLQGLLKTGGLMLYESPELRQHLLNAKVKEHTRGWRIVKSSEAQKIDLTIALAMACQAAQDNFLLRTQAGLIIIEDEDDYDTGDAEQWAEWRYGVFCR
jgi:phage terminase large subunit-like protein